MRQAMMFSKRGTSSAEVDAAIAAAVNAQHSPWITGRYYDSTPGQAPSTSAFGADTLRAIYFYLPPGEAFDQLAVNVTVAATAGNSVRLGVYAIGNDGYPAGLVLDAGTVLIDATGDRTVSVATSPAGGTWYALALLPQASATFAVVNAVTSPLGRATPGATASIGLFKTSVSYGALPTTFPASGTFSNSNAPLITVRAI